MSFSIQNPVTRAVAITPADVGNFALTSGLYVGATGGDAVVEMGDGSTVTLTGLVAGQVYPFRVVNVQATGTTISIELFALYP